MILGSRLFAANSILSPEILYKYIDAFNKNDEEIYKSFITNSEAKQFLSDNIPLFECPDKDLEKIYYFRWWTYRKHIKKTPEGFIITEFMPDVSWAGKYNGISCPAMFHFCEGRWLYDHQYLDAYAHYWLKEGASVRTYTFPIAYSLYQYYLVTGDRTVMCNLYSELVKNFKLWEVERYDKTMGLFWQEDGQDGGEVSICGGRSNPAGYRVTINACMAAEALALSKIAAILHKSADSTFYSKCSEEIKTNMYRILWDKNSSFFKVLSKKYPTALCSVRELHGYTPWCYNMASQEFSSAWQFLMNADYFYAPYGLTTAEQCSPDFTISYEGHECQWNGPSWPFATSITLIGLANELNDDLTQQYVTKNDFYNLLLQFANSHRLTKDDGSIVPWIDENLNPYTGDWIARTLLKSRGTNLRERGKDYNHSTFCDLVITGLIGLRPQDNNQIIVNPLIPEKAWDYFCLENVHYRGRKITILYDRKGTKYNKGIGLMIFADGKKIASNPELGLIRSAL